VQRYAEELGRYQAKYQKLDKQDQIELQSKFGELTLPPWVYASEHMNPLLVAYDNRISELTSENNAFRDSVAYLKQELTSKINENEELHEKLRKQIRMKQDQFERGSVDAEFGVDAEDWYVCHN
jgi:hypothetical protein